MNTIFIVPIEPLETRYTGEWYGHLPATLTRQIADNESEYQVRVIDGDVVSPRPSPGAFLDFAATNIYKSSQLISIAEMFRDGEVKPGDKFLFTDFWNTCALQLRYMSDLNGIPVEIHGLAHAGNYDPNDFLGRIKDGDWAKATEQAFYHAYTNIWFATHTHLDLFSDNVMGSGFEDSADKLRITGWPMEYMQSMNKPYIKTEKKDIVLFPHRLAPEKQPEIFDMLAERMPEYEFIKCQDKELTKREYHTLLAESKVVFSANLQETLGISGPEGMCFGAIPLVPLRLSYLEMFDPEFTYPSEWTTSLEAAEEHADDLVALIRHAVQNYGNLQTKLQHNKNKILRNFFSADALYAELLDL
ncbi:MAG: hypothetical protein CMN60_20140 [Sphingobium sp.]|nr:hypothetical protein [Sphingobium sp.]|tara:strand:+ start:4438 stop:5514 length:1077 start_codon:yes stop_codon:yes gene_type:complete